MTYDEFIAAITAEAPTQENFGLAVGFADSASIETLRAALGVSGINPVFITLINKALNAKVAEANLAASMSNIATSMKPPKPG